MADEARGKPPITPVGLLAPFGIVALLIAALYPAVWSIQRAADRSQRVDNLKHIGITLQNWCDTYRCLPAAVHTDDNGQPLSSWRFRIMPFVEAVMIDVDYEVAWDAPINREITETAGHVFCRSFHHENPDSHQAAVMAVTGPGTAFDPGREHNLKDLPQDLILVVEVADSGIHWMEPGDLRVEDVDDSLLAGPDGDGFCVLFVDGVVRFISRDTPFEDLRPFFTIDGARRHDRSEVLAD